ncbi:MULTISPECIES: MipA/OmpV family protein [unclassified Sphingomonas]|uniref:MipA/OmpV family protein n=1 Tax=unclassified Sphingomonas TaxID=196159 RepID=UPI000E10201F|nr:MULTISPECIES: MipA/OmpV family protein [unclassified Sphingomonas]AXJ96882.1 MipA/OmpV family protein [Sphingomonas sp. FARSPH]
MCRTFLAPLAVSLALIATPAAAQVATPDAGGTQKPAADLDVNRDSITIGLGAAYLPDYEGSNDYSFSPAPGAIGTVKGHDFVLAGNRVSFDLIPNRTDNGIELQAGPIAVLNLNRATTKGIDDPRIRALGKVGTAVELGGYVGVGKTGIVTSPYDRLSVSLSYRHDVAGASDGGIWQPSINYFTPLSLKAAVGLFATAEHADGNYARSYFGITPAQSVASGLAAYNPRGGWKDWNVGALGTYALTGNLLHGFKLVGGVTYGRLLNDFGDSPVVSVAGSRTQWLGALGVAYTF